MTATDAHEINVRAHDFDGNLCTMRGAHFAAAVLNQRIVENESDRLLADHELYNYLPQIEN